MNCSECNGSGGISVSRIHPTDPNKDWWETVPCRKCNGKKEDPKTERLLALLLSVVSNGGAGECTSDPCPVCSVAQEAQSHLNSIHPDRTTGWWWRDNDAAVFAALDELEKGAQ